MQFYLSEEFDYDKYAEKRSHFEYLAEKVDSLRPEVRGYLEDVAPILQQHARELGIQTSILARSHGMLEQIPGLLESIGESVSIVNENLVIGFNQLISTAEKTNIALSSIDDRLRSIDEKLASPSKTMALEDARDAARLLKHGMIEKAHSFIMRAINGDATARGHATEATFYEILGELHLAAVKVKFPRFADLHQASLAFESAANLSSSSDRDHYRRRAADCALANGDIKKAEELFLPTVKEDDASGNFHCAKLNAILGNRDKSLRHIRESIRLDSGMITLFVAEPAFMELRADVSDIARAASRSIEVDLRNLTSTLSDSLDRLHVKDSAWVQVLRESLDRAVAQLERASSVPSEPTANLLALAKTRESLLSNIKATKRKLESLLSSAHTRVRIQSTALAAELRSSQHRTSEFRDGLTAFLMLGAGCLVVLGIVNWVGATLWNITCLPPLECRDEVEWTNPLLAAAAVLAVLSLLLRSGLTLPKLGVEKEKSAGVALGKLSDLEKSAESDSTVLAEALWKAVDGRREFRLGKRVG